MSGGEDAEVRAAQSRSSPAQDRGEGDPTAIGPSDAPRSPDEAPGGTAARSPAGRDGHRRGARGATQEAVDRTQPRSYYGEAVLKEPVWSPEVALYLFTGGLAGASAPLAFAAGLRGNAPLARSAWIAALAGAAISPALLIKDLGRPERFLYMLRVVKLTSPMNVGTWILSTIGPAIGLATVRDVLGWFPRLGAASGGLAAALGPALATYTAVLLADTAVPAWHEARHELPFTFAGSAAASAGGAAVVLTPADHAGPARRLVVMGAALELGSSQLLERRLGELGEPYREGEGGRFLKLSKALTGTGAALVALAGRRRPAAALGGALVLGGAMAARWGIFRAGFASAADPKYVVGPQRRRVDERGTPSSPPR